MSEKDKVIEKETLRNIISQAGGLLPSDGDEIKAFIGTPAGQRLICEFMMASDAVSNLLLVADLSQEAGVKNALKSQGRAFGLLAAAELTLDAAFPETNKE